MTAPRLRLVSHHLCPYVQRAVIALDEKGIAFERRDIDLADKPGWFKALSPLGKVPLLQVDGGPAIFESAVILEYLEETTRPSLHPATPLERADHRAWIEFASAILNDVAGLYTAKEEALFEAKRAALAERFAWVERRAKAEPYFDGPRFSLVDAAFGPVFRYFDAFDRAALDHRVLAGKPKVAIWREALAARPSVARAVAPDYPERLDAFLRRREGHLASLVQQRGAGTAAAAT